MATDDEIIELMKKRLEMFGFVFTGDETESVALAYSLGIAKQQILNFCNTSCVPTAL